MSPVGADQRCLPIAHRGSQLLWPENTITAFQGAVDLGFSWIETDLRLTADGHIVCIHDLTVDRTTNGSGRVRDKGLSEISLLDAGSRFFLDGERPFRGARIPAFADVLAAFPETNWVLDLKEDGLERPLAELVEELGATGRLIVGSFSSERLRNFRELAPGVATSTGPAEAFAVWRKAWRGVPSSRADAIQVPRTYWGLPVVTGRTARGFRRGGLPVHVWTVNRRTEMERLMDIGVDGIITDRPDILRQVMVERGIW